ncbi:hypothetical protein POTOM_022961 [Populus tomentosa]|uniref:Uncharacterized protein n=1 Tax=Populus tomentosa TaxID=118781 RepID=A0A8X8D0F3_POPTO|nr:hypothetical protein POTOM_022961 [Populus tomentosa]
MADLKVQNFVFHLFNSSLNRVIYPKTNQYSPIFTFPNTFIHVAYGTLCASPLMVVCMHLVGISLDIWELDLTRVRNSLATEAFASLSQSIPRLLDAPYLESKQAKMVSWGA